MTNKNKRIKFDMKSKTQPIHIQSGSYLYQACIEGLKGKQLTYAKNQIKNWRELNGEDTIPYGMIRKNALKK